jgi:hypothetical protein
MPAVFPKPNLLEEKPTDKDLIDDENEIKRVSSRIDRFVKRKRNVIVAYLGPFGAGKSSILKQIEESKKTYQWITFELWRYANRQEIWDGFVIQVAAALNNTTELEQADQVEGSTWDFKDIVKPLVVVVLVIGLVGLGFSFLLWEILKGTSTADSFLRAFLKYAAPVLVALIVVGGAGTILSRLKLLQNKRPLKRVFELESLLSNSLESKLQKPLIIVAEDVDRTTEDGVVFLETLSHFLNVSAPKLKQPIVVIAPQTQVAFDSIGNGGLGGFERSLKIYDETIYFGSYLNDNSIEKFYNALEVDTQYRGNLITATKILLGTYRQYMTIRLLKHVLREVDSFITINEGANPIIAMVFIMARYMPARFNATQQGPAMNVLVSGAPYNSEQASALFRALVIAGGNPEPTARQFVCSFDTVNTEITYETFTHTVGSVEGRIKVDNKYHVLVEGTF